MQCKKAPNILICGTPGTGKSTLASQLAEQLGGRFINVGDLARDKNLYDGFDEERQCHVLDEEKVNDELEEVVEGGGNVVDYHDCDFFAERYFDLIVVLRTNNTILYDRLAHRGYPESKIRENVECEIFGVTAEEAKESYPSKVVIELKNDTVDDLEDNLTQIQLWCEEFMKK